MEPGDKYLNGSIDLGALGKQDILILPNEDKEKEKHPSHLVFIRLGEDKGLKECGGLWTNEKKSSEDVEPETQEVY